MTNIMKKHSKSLRSYDHCSGSELPWLLLLTTTFYLAAAIACDVTEGETFFTFCMTHADLLKPLFFLFGYTLVLGVVVVVRMILNLNAQWETSLRLIQGIQWS